MQNLNKDTRACTNPELTAGRLMSIRNIYLRQELSTISDEIQENYNERLPALDLVSLAAYEQVFNRQPLSLPEDLRRNAIKYGLKYYRLNIEKLRKAEVKNGLVPIHDRLSDFKNESNNTIESNDNLSVNDQIDENQSNSSSSQSSTSLNETQDEDNSNESFSTDNTFDSTFTDTTNNIETTSDESSTIKTNKNDISSSISSSSIDTSNDTNLNSFATDPLLTRTSNGSMTTTKTHQSAALIKKLSRTKPPKIIVRRPSNNSLISIDTENSSMTINRNETSTEEQAIDIHHLSPNKQKSKKQRKHTSN
ncbi:unnamed protein product [Rotaria sordida]|uniref:Uncharacterized protein n=1 Tax=Rotaria sordida TaxID=392033 RepID=A0A814WSX8_9BILA|nr:unnamed protein product [Rotaria sordida]